MDMLALAALAALAALIAAQVWYSRWCARNGVEQAAGATSMDGLACSDGDGGD
jgi:hypothetical protein